MSFALVYIKIIVTKCCFMKGQTVFQALGACLHTPFAAWKHIPFEPAVLSHFCHTSSRHLSANVHRRFVCHFKDDCCLCLVGRGQRSSQYLVMHSTAPSKMMSLSKDVSYMDILWYTVSIKPSLKRQLVDCACRCSFLALILNSFCLYAVLLVLFLNYLLCQVVFCILWS